MIDVADLEQYLDDISIEEKISQSESDVEM